MKPVLDRSCSSGPVHHFLNILTEKAADDIYLSEPCRVAARLLRTELSGITN